METQESGIALALAPFEPSLATRVLGCRAAGWIGCPFEGKAQHGLINGREIKSLSITISFLQIFLRYYDI